VSDAKPGTADPITSAEYIRANFEPSERIAMLLRNAQRRETLQRISTVEKIAANPFQEWLRYKNFKEGFDIYVGMNALKPTAFTRTKDDILAIRHLYVDLDRQGLASLAMIETSALVPPPNFVLHTSPNKFQAIWRVDDIELRQAEALLHAMAREFDADIAATDAARVLRVPGFQQKVPPGFSGEHSVPDRPTVSFARFQASTATHRIESSEPSQHTAKSGSVGDSTYQPVRARLGLTLKMPLPMALIPKN
jgi:RepB DNA-primase from phage plasmid